MRFLRDLPDVEGKKVLLRSDFDVPIENGQVVDDSRIKAAVPTINFLLTKKAKVVIAAHLGRPKGVEPQLSLKPIRSLLEHFLRRQVRFLLEPEPLNLGTLNLLENLRFSPGEETNDEDFAKRLAALGDFYVNDAFAVCHRSHASIVGIPKLLPSFAGAHLEQEINELSRILKKPERPLIGLIGGAKIETKLPAIINLSKIADKVLVGGKLMFEVERRALPENVVVAHDDVDTKDIGKLSIGLFKELISEAKTVVWNGPLGMFEDERYLSGTREIAISVVESGRYSVVGGGDTIAALNKLNLLSKVNFVSMGGGAMLEFLAGKKLPGLEALENANS